MSPPEKQTAIKKIPEEIIKLLKGSYFAYLCTADEENMPHVTPIFFVYDELLNMNYFVSSLKSRKISNMRVNRRVSVTVDARDPVDPFNNVGVVTQGEARLEFEITPDDSPSNMIFPQPALSAFQMLKKKYDVLRQTEPSFSSSMSLIRRFSEVLVSVKPMRMIYWQGGGRFRRVQF